MSRYRKIDPRIWTDEKFRRLTADEQRVALYILTAQSNRIGLFSFSPGKACEDLGTLPPTFRKGFLKACQTLNWEWDAKARVLYLPTWWKYNPPENVNNVIGNLKDLEDLPETPLQERFSTNTTYLSEGFIETFTQTLAKRYPQRSPKRSPSQEQEQEQEEDSPLPPRGSVAALNGLQPEGILQKWNALSGVKPCKTLDKDMRTRILTRLTEHPDPAWWDGLFQQVTASDFLCGRTDGTRGAFQATLDWILGPKILRKVVRGNYDNRRSTNKDRIPL
jgi:hypothetical protein